MQHSISTALFLLTFVLMPHSVAGAQDDWKTALSQMSLRTNVLELNLLQGAPTLLNAFSSNQTVKALIILPGATDELHFYNRGVISWSNSIPSLAEAIAAVTNRTRLKTLFLSPMLLLLTTNDHIESQILARHLPTASLLDRRPNLDLPGMADASWHRLAPALKRALDIEIDPRTDSTAWWHFYRAHLSGFDLTAREAITAVCLAAKVSCSIEQSRLVFSDRSK